MSGWILNEKLFSVGYRSVLFALLRLRPAVFVTRGPVDYSLEQAQFVFSFSRVMTRDVRDM